MLSVNLQKGILLEKSSIDAGKLAHLVNNLPKNLIIRICGFAGTGKGTLSENLSEILNIPNVESSLIWRGIAYVYKDLGLDLNNQNTDLVCSKLQVEADVNKSLVVQYQNKIIAKPDLKSESIDAIVSIYAGDSYARSKFYEILSGFLNRLSDSCILDGRGVNPPYIPDAEKNGFKIIRLFLDSSNEIKADRYYKNYFRKKILENPNYIETDEKKSKILTDFTKGVIERNKKDHQTWIDLDIGVTTDDTGIIDTGNMTIDEVKETALNFIYGELVKEIN